MDICDIHRTDIDLRLGCEVVTTGDAVFDRGRGMACSPAQVSLTEQKRCKASLITTTTS